MYIVVLLLFMTIENLRVEICAQGRDSSLVCGCKHPSGIHLKRKIKNENVKELAYQQFLQLSYLLIYSLLYIKPVYS